MSKKTQPKADKLKDIEKEQTDKSEKDVFDDSLDINRKILTVHSQRVQEILSDDVVMAFLPEKKDKTYIMEMVQSSFLCINCLLDLHTNMRNFYKEQMQIDKIPEEIEIQMNNEIKRTSDIFLARIHTFLDLSRNVTGNPIVMASLGNIQESNAKLEDESMSDTMKSIKKALENQEKTKEGEKK